jgi:hypothetical protein
LGFQVFDLVDAILAECQIPRFMAIVSTGAFALGFSAFEFSGKYVAPDEMVWQGNDLYGMTED